MLSDEGTPKCRFANYCWCWWNRKLRLGLYAYAYVYDVGQKYGYKIKELNYQEGEVAWY
jgi:hypothetical protein